MTSQSGRPQKRSENAPGQKVSKQRNRKKDQPLSKLQCEKNKLVLEGVSKPRVLIQSPEKGVRLHCDEPRHPATDPLVGLSPLPLLGWSSFEDVWSRMVTKEQNYRHSKSFLQKHPTLQARMRSILLDWLIEVSEAYKLHRQTFYLAQDYFDRFMLTQANVEKGILQLIGITCLFIASKMEEACPPKLSEMAYVTAGTYFENEILQMELIILKALCWNLCPETAVSWLKLYFQMASMNANSDLLESQFSQDTYIQMTRLLDLCILNINSLDFKYRVLAASVLCHFLQQEEVEELSGLSRDAIQPCLNWMAPFVESMSRFGQATLRDLSKIDDDRHNIQTHTDYMSMLDDASKKEVNSQFPTPPSSAEKAESTH